MLPKIDVPIYDLKLPSTGKSVRFRPFLVKEEKLFLMAAESEDIKTVVNTIKQVIQNCCLDDIDVNKLPIFDIEYFFMNLRARSVGEVIELNYRCMNEIETEDGKVSQCKGVEKFDINLLEIQPTKNKEHTNKIQITKKLGMIMKYPSFDLFENFSADINNENIAELIINCIDSIYDESEVYYAKDTPKEELIEFVDGLPRKTLDELKKFFDTMPKISKTLNFKCKKCQHEEDIEIEGVQNFFV